MSQESSQWEGKMAGRQISCLASMRMCLKAHTVTNAREEYNREVKLHSKVDVMYLKLQEQVRGGSDF